MLFSILELRKNYDLDEQNDMLKEPKKWQWQNVDQASWL